MLIEETAPKEPPPGGRETSIEAPPTPPGREVTLREDRVDLLRGFCVVMMLFGHLGWRALETHFRIGFMTLAEGFFLTSGATLGIVAARFVAPGRESRLERRLLRRGAWLWIVHLVSVGLYRALTGPFFPEPESRRFWRGVEPLWTWLSFDQPSVLNVLPRFALFLVLAPLALRLVRQRRHGLLLAISAGLWLANFASSGALAIPGFEGARAPYPSASWQLLFFGGLAVSHRWCVGPLPKVDRRNLGVGLSVCLALVALAVFAQAGPLGERIPAEWISRPLLGPVRLLNVIAAAILATALVTRFRAPLRRATGWLLEPYGRQALPAFILHIPLVWALLFLPAVGHDDTLRKPVAAALILLLLLVVRRPGIRRWLAP